MTRTIKRWTWSIVGVGFVAAVLLVMAEIDSLLLSIQNDTGRPSGLAAIQGLAFSGADADAAFKLWFGDKVEVNVGLLVGAYAGLDCLFAIAYGTGLFFALRGLYPSRPVFWWLGAGAAAADVAENIVIGIAAARRSLADNIFVLSGIKWGLLGAALVLFGWAVVQRLLLDTVQQQIGRWVRVLWQFRVQVLIVGLLAAVVAVPSKDRLGFLQQLPDLLRSYADFPPGWQWWMLGSGAALGLACAAVWITGHWLNFGATTETAKPVPRRREVLWWVVGLLAAGALAIGVSRLFADLGKPPWASRIDHAGPSLLVFVVLAALLAFHYKGGNQRLQPSPLTWSYRHALLLNLLVAACVAVVGLGLIRAYGVTVLLPRRTAEVWVFLGLGVVLASAVPVLVFRGLRLLAPGELDTAEAAPRRIHWAWTTALIVVALAIIATFSVFPQVAGPIVGANAVLGLSATVGCVVFGGLLAASQRSTPLLRYLDDQRPGQVEPRPLALPTLLTALVVITALGRADSISTYDDVIFQEADAAPVTIKLEDAFMSWRQSVEECGPATSRVQPLLIVSAAGGGIRAAYWTEAALDMLTREPGLTGTAARCSRDSVFLVSSTSGGSVGAALWASRPPATSVPIPPEERALGASLLASGSALASVTSAMLFRDTIRAFTPIVPDWDDRAAVMERSWIESLKAAPAYSGLDGNFLDLAGPDSADDPWQPLLMFNSADLLTECRMVVTKLKEPTAGHPFLHCDNSGQPTEGLPGSYYVTQFNYSSACQPDKQLSVASAAMLSARFPFVTPTGSMYACRDDVTKKENVRRVQLGDGGYIEASGMLTALQQWRELEDLVAKHNALTPEQRPALKNAVILPIFVEISNSYRSEAQPPLTPRQPELIAPILGADAKQVLASAPRIEDEIRSTFATESAAQLREKLPVDCRLDQMLVVVAPESRPENTAPLGWALSERSQEAMSVQLDENGAPERLNPLRRLMTGACVPLP